MNLQKNYRLLLTIVIFILLPNLNITAISESATQTDSYCYGLIVPISENIIDDYQWHYTQYMINDFLRCNVTVYWATENFSALSTTMENNDFDFQKHYTRGSFIIPFTGIAEIDSKIITLAYDFNETHELDRLENTGPKPYKHCHRISDDKCEVITDFNTVDTYFLLQPININSYKLIEPRIVQHNGKGCISYHNHLLKRGFLNTDYLSDGEINKKLNNDDYNVFLWPGGNIPSNGLKGLFFTALHVRDQQAIRDFIANGGGYVGSCYGAYTVSCGMVLPFTISAYYFKNIPSAGWLSLSDTSTTIAFPCRYAQLKEKIINSSHPVTFGISGDTVHTSWEGGPVFNYIGENTEVIAEIIDANGFQGNFSFIPLTLREKWIEYTVGKASWISSKYGKGKIIAFGPHPEKRYPVLENALFYTTGKKQRTETINSHNFSFIEKIYTITNNITISKNQSKDFCELRDIITKIHNHNISILLNNIKENLSNNPPKILISNGKFPDGYSAIYLFHEETNDLINAFTNFDYVYELLENLETSSNEKQKIEQYKSDMKNLLGKIEKIKLEQKV